MLVGILITFIFPLMDTKIKKMSFSIKPIIIFLILILISFSGKAQSIKTEKVKEKSISLLLNNIRNFIQFKVKNIAITIVEVSNGAGSAKIPETEEVTSNLYLGVSEIDTYPEQNLFLIKDLYAISDIVQDISKPEVALISFKYIDIATKSPQKKEVKIRLTQNDISVVSISNIPNNL